MPIDGVNKTMSVGDGIADLYNIVQVLQAYDSTHTQDIPTRQAAAFRLEQRGFFVGVFSQRYVLCHADRMYVTPTVFQYMFPNMVSYIRHQL